MGSSIAWLDFSDHDRRKMLEVISLFKERDTRDELGLAPIRDAFAGLLFPGTSTLQTRARYFLFTPWLYRSYETRKVPSDQVARRLRRDEIRLIHALKDSGDTEGIIGQISGAGLHRFPSSIYWNGLRRWGILRFPGTQDQYHRSLDLFYRQRAERQMTDDKEPVAGSMPINWDPNLPDAPTGFPGQTDFYLTGEEAAYLRERLLISCSGSLLAHLVDRCPSVEGVDFAWLHPQAAEFPPRLQDWLAHARNFSEAMHGAALLYNLMLAELREDEERVVEYRTRLDRWRAMLTARHAALACWDRNAFWALVTKARHVSGPTHSFVGAWLDLLLSGPAVPDVSDHKSARRLVREREIRLKRGRSRFESPRHLEMWSGAAGTAQLNYRWPVANRIANDIIRGLGIE
jgi:hypothetical protein